MNFILIVHILAEVDNVHDIPFGGLNIFWLEICPNYLHGGMHCYSQHI